jgi:geranylgeranyl reductase family protein
VTAPIETDVLVVGGGPAGAAVASTLATAGRAVTLLEKRAVPRRKVCGEALTPRAIAELTTLGVGPLGGHQVLGVEMRHGRHRVEVPWPVHPALPDRGMVLPRDRLDETLRQHARERGATVLMGREATAPIVERGFIRGAQVALDGGGSCRAHARFVVVADGARSRFGRVLGTTRDARWPYAIATRSRFHSGRADRPWIEATLGLPDENGTPTAGYGWVVPVGDGTVNVGIGLLSTYRAVKSVNSLKLLHDFVASVADRWQLDPDRQLTAATRLRIPLGGSVSPKMGPTFLVVGDAAGAANPFTGIGIDSALLTGRLAGTVLDEALGTASAALQRYPTLLADELGRYHHVGRLVDRFIGRPAVLRPLLRHAAGNDALMGGILRIVTDELRTTETGAAERAYAVAAALSRLAPSW